MKISEVTFKKTKEKVYLYLYYDNGKVEKYKVKDKNKDLLLYLLTNITILDKYREEVKE